MLLPASSPAPVPFSGQGCSRASPPASLPMAGWATPRFVEAGAAAHRPPGVPWGSGAGLGWRMRAVLGIPLPTLADPWERPGWPGAGLPLGSFLLLNGKREMLKGRREKGGGTWVPPGGMAGLEEDCAGGRLLSLPRARHWDACHEEGSGPPDVSLGKTGCRGVPAETLGSRSRRGAPSLPACLDPAPGPREGEQG